MKTLMVATNATPDSLRQDVLAGKHHRVDYFELADRLGGRYVDYNIVAENSALRRLEQKLRMDMRLAQRVARLVRREGYDAVLSLSERVGLPLAALLPREVAHLVIMHYAMSKPKIELIKVAGLARRWRKIMTLSDAESRGLEAALGLARGSAMTLRTPVDVDFYRPIDNVPLAAQDHIQSLGLSHRDYPTLLRAMRRLPDITCHLRVGSAWVSGRAGHENEALPPNVVLQPFVQPRELRACYARSRFIVVPIRNSTQWSAGCTSVQAAQAMGRAVIATAMPGLSEYLINGETGILVGISDDQALAKAIEYLWRNPQIAERMGRRGREWLVANFSLDQWLERVVSAVHEAVSGACNVSDTHAQTARHAAVKDAFMIPFNDLKPLHNLLADELNAAALRALNSGWYILGPELAAFEAEFAAYHGVAHAVGVANGTDAIELALRAGEVGPGDEVITVSHTAVPTVCAVERAGATPVLVEIDPDTYTMDPAAARAAITPRTKALLPVHLYGHPADMDALGALAAQHNLLLVEDCAQAHGARWRGRRVGTFGHMAAFSFYPTKNLGAAGDGGAVITNDAQLAERLRLLRNYGQRARYHNVMRGVNSRLDEVQAALLRVKLAHLDAHNAQRRALAAVYDRALTGVTLPRAVGDVEHVYHLYVVRHPRRDRFMEALKAHGVGTLIHYPVPIHRQEAYADLGYGPGSLPLTEQIAQEIVSLPLYIGLTAHDAETVAAAARQAAAETV